MSSLIGGIGSDVSRDLSLDSLTGCRGEIGSSSKYKSMTNEFIERVGRFRELHPRLIIKNKKITYQVSNRTLYTRFFSDLPFSCEIRPFFRVRSRLSAFGGYPNFFRILRNQKMLLLIIPYLSSLLPFWYVYECIIKSSNVIRNPFSLRYFNKNFYHYFINIKYNLLPNFPI